MLTASILAKKAEVPVYTVRHYTNIGLLHPSKREDNGYKIYKQSDLILLRFIMNAKKCRMTSKCRNVRKFAVAVSEVVKKWLFHLVLLLKNYRQNR